MNSLDLARWQFAITTVYHFIFVPITIGSGFLVAGLQTAWYRTGKESYLRATKFFGKLFLINFALALSLTHLAAIRLFVFFAMLIV